MASFSTGRKRQREDDTSALDESSGSPPRKRQRQCGESEVISLNVGGTIFATMKSTLFNIENTYFVQRFSGKYDDGPQLNGAYFIDRDPTHFRRILQYLRDQNVVFPEEKQLLDELLIEARYYGMDSMVKAIQSKQGQLIRDRNPQEVLLQEISRKLGQVITSLGESTDANMLTAGAAMVADVSDMTTMQLDDIYELLEQRLR